MSYVSAVKGDLRAIDIIIERYAYTFLKDDMFSPGDSAMADMRIMVPYLVASKGVKVNTPTIKGLGPCVYGYFWNRVSDSRNGRVSGYPKIER